MILHWTAVKEQIQRYVMRQKRQGVTVVILVHDDRGNVIARKMATRGLTGMAAVLAMAEPIAVAREVMNKDDN